VVTRDVSDYAMVYGNPARLHGWVCYCGTKLQFTAATDDAATAECSACARRYSRLGQEVKQLP
jgi:UDP-2-acetamido-3-amino-2,3-dideoxy-glucuronate N-acetyltransferase